MWRRSDLCPQMSRGFAQRNGSALQVFGIASLWICLQTNSTFTFIFWLSLHFYFSQNRIELENGQGIKEEGSRSLTFALYLVIRTVLNIFMNASYNIAVSSYRFQFPLNSSSAS